MPDEENGERIIGGGLAEPIERRLEICLGGACAGEQLTLPTKELLRLRGVQVEARVIVGFAAETGDDDAVVSGLERNREQRADE